MFIAAIKMKTAIYTCSCRVIDLKSEKEKRWWLESAILKSRKTVRDNAVVELRLLFMSINLIRHSFSGIIQVPRCLSGCGSVIKS